MTSLGAGRNAHSHPPDYVRLPCHANSKPLADKIAVILGGSGGIGAATARHFAAAGARVAVVAGQDNAKAASRVAALPGDRASRLCAAIDNTAALPGSPRPIEADFGGAGILVNSAGFTRRFRMPISRRWMTRCSIGCCA